MGYPLDIDPLALLLRNQGLTDPLPDPDAALERVVAVQTQYAQSLEIALAARSRKGLKGWEAGALAPEGHAHKSLGLRHTLHTHGPEGWALVHDAVGAAMHARHHRRMAEIQGFDGLEIERRVLELLADGPLSRAELHARIPGLAELPGAGWGRDVAGAAYLGGLKVVGRGAMQRFARSDARVPSREGERPPLPEESGMPALLRAYLQAYGPATLRDFAYWTGFPQRDVRPAFEALSEEIELVEGGFVRKGSREGIPAPRGAILLAKFDPLTLGHADKSRWLSDEDRGRVFRKAAQVEAVVLLRGRAAATWRLARTRTRARVTVEPFRPLNDSEKRSIERMAARLERSIGWGEVVVDYG